MVLGRCVPHHIHCKKTRFWSFCGNFEEQAFGWGLEPETYWGKKRKKERKRKNLFSDFDEQWGNDSRVWFLAGVFQTTFQEAELGVWLATPTHLTFREQSRCSSEEETPIKPGSDGNVYLPSQDKWPFSRAFLVPFASLFAYHIITFHFIYRAFMVAIFT